MLELKPITKDGIPNALEKAIRYRLLNDPWQAESICRDVLRTEPGNQAAVMTLVLSITDQFEGEYRTSLHQALELVAQIEDSYQAEYCSGIIYERQATAALKRSTPRSGYIAYEHLRMAMKHYEQAQQHMPEHVEDAILRWNACARMINRHGLKPAPEEKGVQPFLDV
jgi:hypothetical protein